MDPVHQMVVGDERSGEIAMTEQLAQMQPIIFPRELRCERVLARPVAVLKAGEAEYAGEPSGHPPERQAHQCRARARDVRLRGLVSGKPKEG